MSSLSALVSNLNAPRTVSGPVTPEPLFAVNDHVIYLGHEDTDIGAPIKTLPDLDKGVVQFIAPDGLLVYTDQHRSEFWPFTHKLVRIPLALCALACMFLASCQTTHGFSIGIGVSKKTGNIGINLAWIPQDVIIQREILPTGKSPVPSPQD